MAETLNFPWETLNTIVGGGSAIDVPRLYVKTSDEAESFLECYGFSWSVDSHRRELDAVRREAISYIEEELLGGQSPMPDELLDQEDVRQLLLWGSEPPNTVRQQWVCALLRVMHTISHADSYLNRRFSRQIRRQIIDRYKPHLHIDVDKLTLGRGKGSIPLVRFEVKESKPLRSTITKLLHKVENVAADIFDRVGVRFVTQDRLDTLLVVQYLRQKNVVMFANIKPSRSRNTLIDINWLRDEIDRLDRGEEALERSQRVKRLRESLAVRPFPSSNQPFTNRFSSVDYHSIQFTCRQQIRVRDMLADERQGGEMRFFFPFEVQVLDAESYQMSRDGLASHEVYKRRQRREVQRRVMGPLILTDIA